MTLDFNRFSGTVLTYVQDVGYKIGFYSVGDSYWIVSKTGCGSVGEEFHNHADILSWMEIPPREKDA